MMMIEDPREISRYKMNVLKVKLLLTRLVYFFSLYRCWRSTPLDMAVVMYLFPLVRKRNIFAISTNLCTVTYIFFYFFMFFRMKLCILAVENLHGSLIIWWCLKLAKYFSDSICIVYLSLPKTQVLYPFHYMCCLCFQNLSLQKLYKSQCLKFVVCIYYLYLTMSSSTKDSKLPREHQLKSRSMNADIFLTSITVPGGIHILNEQELYRSDLIPLNISILE